MMSPRVVCVSLWPTGTTTNFQCSAAALKVVQLLYSLAAVFVARVEAVAVGDASKFPLRR